MTVLVLKRTSDKLDAVLAAVIFFLGLTVFGIYLSAPRSTLHLTLTLFEIFIFVRRLTCVPVGCVGRPYTANCARDWVFLRYLTFN